MKLPQPVKNQILQNLNAEKRMAQTLICFLLFWGTNANAQVIQLIEDLAPGPAHGYSADGQLHQDEVYFISAIANFELHKVNLEHNIEKVYGLPDAFVVEQPVYVDNLIYFQGFSQEFLAGILQYDLESGLTEFLLQVTDEVQQKVSLQDGAIYVFENAESLDRNIYYFENGMPPQLLVENIKQGASDFDITETNDHIIISPQNDSDYDGGAIFYNKSTGEMDDTYLEDLCGDIRFAYGFEDVVIYFCNNIIYAQKPGLETMNLDVAGLHPLNAYYENSEYIFFRTEFLKDFYSLRKGDLTIEKLSAAMTSFVDLFDESGYVYFSEKNGTGFDNLIRCEGSLESKIEIDYPGERLRLNHGAVLNGKTHFVVAYDALTGFNRENIAVLDEDLQVVDLHEISQDGANSIFETVGSGIVFSSFAPDLGTELYTLTYPLSQDNIQIKNDLFYPSISADGVLRSLRGHGNEFELFDAHGRLIAKYNNVEQIILPHRGNFFIRGISEEQRFIQKVIRI